MGFLALFECFVANGAKLDALCICVLYSSIVPLDNVTYNTSSPPASSLDCPPPPPRRAPPSHLGTPAATCSPVRSACMRYTGIVGTTGGSFKHPFQDNLLFSCSAILYLFVLHFHESCTNLGGARGGVSKAISVANVIFKRELEKHIIFPGICLHDVQTMAAWEPRMGIALRRCVVVPTALMSS